MIKGEDIIEDILKFKGFWKASFSDKMKWLLIYPFIFISVLLMLFRR
jgi:hypothetical protein